MHQALALLLLRVRQTHPQSVLRVDVREVGGLEAELGRPLPKHLKWLWQVYGCGDLGSVHLSGPKAISAGLVVSDHFLDEGLLPFATGPDGEPWGLKLDSHDDPDVVLAVEFPRRLRATLGPLSLAIEVVGLAALRDHRPTEEEFRSLEGRLKRLDPQGRFLEPTRWASAPVSRALGA